MLYLSRKLGESIIINGNIEVKVIEVKGKSVKLGFEYPPAASILRKELADKIAEQNLAAASQQDDFDIFSAFSDYTINSQTFEKNKNED